MKSVLMSIQPRWCALIASGNKKVEVRKTRPNLDVPFKCYIYCTKDGFKSIFQNKPYLTHNRHTCNGKVIGEFVCDKIYETRWVVDFEYGNQYWDVKYNSKDDCLTDDELAQYIRNKAVYYGWHITNLVIYDEPKELSEFYVEGDCDCMNCKKCSWFDRGNGHNVEDDCNLAYKGMAEHKSFKPIIRPPQSWCYVEEVTDERN